MFKVEIKIGRLLLLSAVVMSMALVSCQQSNSSFDSTEEAAETSPTLTSTATAQPTDTPSPTSTITRTPYPPTPESQHRPDIFRGPIAADLLFSGDDSCRLPCWYGLRMGKSSVQDIQTTFRQAVDLPDDYVFNMGENYLYGGPTSAGHVAFAWKGDGPQELFLLRGLFNPQNDTLTTLSINTTLPEFTRQATAQRVMQEIGVPAAVWVLGQLLVHDASLYSLKVDIIYTGVEGDMFIPFNYAIPVEFGPETRSNGLSVTTATWCLDGGPRQEQHGFSMEIFDAIEPEYTDQSEWYVPLEQVFHITPKALYERVKAESNTCLEFKF